MFIHRVVLLIFEIFFVIQLYKLKVEAPFRVTVLLFIQTFPYIFHISILLFIYNFFFSDQSSLPSSSNHRDIRTIHKNQLVSATIEWIILNVFPLLSCRGTHGYMAPEVLSKGTAYDSSADWFSFGCMLYKLLKGHSPFRQHKTRDKHEIDRMTLTMVSHILVLLLLALADYHCRERMEKDVLLG